MATIKITDLPPSSGLNSNTQGDIFVGVNLSLPRTEKYTAKQLAQGLYVDNPLNVGGAPIVLLNTLGQFVGANPLYAQLNVQNFDPSGTTDYVATGDIGSDDAGFCNFGIAGGVWSKAGQSSILPYDGYLHVVGPLIGSTPRSANLVLSAGSVGSNVVVNAGGRDKSNTVVVFSSNTIALKNSTKLIFPDGTIQTSASVNVNSAIQTLNTDIRTANAFLQANDALTLSVALAYTDVANVYNTNLRNQANTFLQANDAITLGSAKIYTDSTNNWIQNWVAGGGAPVVSQAQFNAAVGALNANDFVTLTVAQGYTDTVNTRIQLELIDVRTSVQQSNNFNQSYTNLAVVGLQGDIAAAEGIAQAYTDTANIYNQGLINTVNVRTIAANTAAYAYTDTANNWNKAYTDAQVFGVGNSNTYNQQFTQTANNYNQALTAAVAADLVTANTTLTANDYATWLQSQSYIDTANNYLQQQITQANNYLSIRIQAVNSAAFLFTTSEIASANDWLQANDYLTWTTSQAYTDQANSWLQSHFAGENAAIGIANTFLQANDRATLTSAIANDIVALTNAYANDTVTLASARANDFVTFTNSQTTAYANDFITWTASQNFTSTANTFLSTRIWNDQGTYQIVKIGATLQSSGTAAPATGTWTRGSIVWNTTAAVGQPIGWQCTVAGTPGTWVAMANL